MNPITVKEIGRAVGFPTEDEHEIRLIETDSRMLTPGSMFVALRGENFDGHDYVEAAFEKGASYALVDHGDRQDKRLIFCEDTEQGFLDIAGWYRDQFSPKVVGVTGSVGKTTTKEMIASVLEAQFKTLKTEGNFNNRVGLPKTLFRLDESHEAAVIEMGMNQFGEISDLTRRAKPDIGVITNIGVAHIEFLGSRDGILKAKTEIRDGMKEGSPLILCGDDDKLCAFRDDRFPVILYGIDNKEAQVRAENIREVKGHTIFHIVTKETSFETEIPTFGRHNVYNALAAYAVGKQFGMEDSVIAQALKNYVPSGMRQRVVEHHGFTVVEDCYNCGPDSLRAATAAFGSMKCEGKKYMILGDMLELGEIADGAHYESGRFAVEKGIDAVYCCGPLSRNTWQGAVDAGGTAYHFDTKEELTKALLPHISAGDVLWFKASHSVGLEDVIKEIYKER